MWGLIELWVGLVSLEVLSEARGSYPAGQGKEAHELMKRPSVELNN